MTDAPTVVPIIPMKPLKDAKSRLSEQLSDGERADLTLGMLRRVLTAIRAADIDLFWVVGGDERIRNLARNFDGLWLEDFGRNLNDTMSKSFGQAHERGYSALYLPGDLPFIKPADLHTLLRASGHRNNITLAPARQDGGTNGILVPLGMAFQPELGPRSFTRHLGQAGKLGISVAICYSPGLGFDLDTVADLNAYEHMEPDLRQRLIPKRGAATDQRAEAGGSYDISD